MANGYWVLLSNKHGFDKQVATPSEARHCIMEQNLPFQVLQTNHPALDPSRRAFLCKDDFDTLKIHLVIMPTPGGRYQQRFDKYRWRNKTMVQTLRQRMLLHEEKLHKAESMFRSQQQELKACKLELEAELEHVPVPECRLPIKYFIPPQKKAGPVDAVCRADGCFSKAEFKATYKDGTVNLFCHKCLLDRQDWSKAEPLTNIQPAPPKDTCQAFGCKRTANVVATREDGSVVKQCIPHFRVHINWVKAEKIK